MPEKTYTITLTAQEMQIVFNMLDQSVKSAGLGALQSIDRQLIAIQAKEKEATLENAPPLDANGKALKIP